MIEIFTQADLKPLFEFKRVPPPMRLEFELDKGHTYLCADENGLWLRLPKVEAYDETDAGAVVDTSDLQRHPIAPDTYGPVLGHRFTSDELRALDERLGRSMAAHIERGETSQAWIDELPQSAITLALALRGELKVREEQTKQKPQETIVQDERQALNRFKEELASKDISRAVNELNKWLELDTWAPIDGFLLMVGMDPKRTERWLYPETNAAPQFNPPGAPYTIGPSETRVDEGGRSRVKVIYLTVDRRRVLDRLWELWLSNPEHSLEKPHPPHYYRDWAKQKGFETFLDLPGLRWGNTTTEIAPAAPALPEKAKKTPSENPDTPLQVNDKVEVETLKKTDLITRLRTQWPSIENDLKETSKKGYEGLKNSRIKRGVYDVNLATEWAKSNGRWKGLMGKAGLNSMHNLPVSKNHRLSD